MRAQLRAQLFKRLRDARLQIERVQPIQQEQAANQIVTPKPVNDRLARLAGFIDDRHHALDAGPVKFHDQLKKLQGAGARSPIGQALDLVNQRLDLLYALLKLLLFHSARSEFRSQEPDVRMNLEGAISGLAAADFLVYSDF